MAVSYHNVSGCTHTVEPCHRFDLVVMECTYTKPNMISAVRNRSLHLVLRTVFFVTDSPDNVTECTNSAAREILSVPECTVNPTAYNSPS